MISALVIATLVTTATAGQDGLLEEQAATGHRVLVLSAANSLGAYQAGVIHSVVRMNRLDQRAKGPGQQDILISAVSAGAVNGLLALLETCKSEASSPDFEDSLFWSAWQGLQWEEMFTDRGDHLADMSVLDTVFAEVHAQLEGKQHDIEGQKHEVERKSFEPGCSGVLAISLASMTPYIHRIGQHQVPTYRRVAFIKMTVDNNGRVHFQDESQLMAERIEDLRGRLLRLAARSLPKTAGSDGDDTRRLSLLDVAALAGASSSPPYAVAPRPFEICSQPAPTRAAGDPGCPPGWSRQIERLYDAAVFDLLPVSAGRDIAQVYLPRPLAQRELVAVQSLYEDRDKGDELTQAVGYRFYKAFVPELLETARDYELQTLLRYHRLRVERTATTSTSAPTLVVLRRPEVLAGDTLYGFGAYLAEVLREYDFVRGMLAGVEWRTRDEKDLAKRIQAVEHLLEALDRRPASELLALYGRVLLPALCEGRQGCIDLSRLDYRAAMHKHHDLVALHEVLHDVRKAYGDQPLTQLRALSRGMKARGAAFDGPLDDFRGWWSGERLRLTRRIRTVYGRGDRTLATGALALEMRLSLSSQQEAGWNFGSIHFPPGSYPWGWTSVLVPESYAWSFPENEAQLRWRWVVGSVPIDTQAEGDPAWFRFYAGPYGVWKRIPQRPDRLQLGPSMGMGVQYHFPWSYLGFLNGEIGTRGYLTGVINGDADEKAGNRLRLGAEGYWRPLHGWVEIVVGRRTRIAHRGSAFADPELYVAVGAARLDALTGWILRLGLE